MQLENGDWDDLEGRVLVYGKLSRDLDPSEVNIYEEQPFLKKGSVYALYASVDPISFISGFNSDHSSKEKAEKIEKSRKFFEMIGIKSVIHPVFVHPCLYVSERFMPKLDMDVLNVRDFSYPEQCRTAVGQGLSYYLARFYDQSTKEKKEITIETSNWKKVDKDSINRYVTDRYILPMIDSLFHGKKEKFKEIRRRFKTFSSGGIEQYSNLLCKEIYCKKENINTALTDECLNMISALRSENYEDARVISKRLNDLKSSL